MATLPGLTKDPSPPPTDTQVSPIAIPDGTTLITTKVLNKIIDYLSGDASPDFISQAAIADLVSDLAGKENSLGFTPENIANKVTTIGTPGNDTNYGTEKAIRDALNLKEDSLGFTPENVANKNAVNGYAGLDASTKVAVGQIPTAIPAINIADGSVDNSEFQTLNGVTSSIQTQLNAKEPSLGFTPENIANKGAVSGYAPLVTGLVPVANLGSGTPDGTKFLRDDGTFVTPPGGGGGEANTSSNAIADSSTEKGLAKAKSGVDLPFRVVAIGSTNLSIASDPDKVTLDVIPANLSGIPQSGITNLVTDLSNKQPLDADLTAIAGLVPTNDDIIQRKIGAWVNRTPVQFKVDLALVKADVGLSNVDNTSDANKPVSTATQTALDLKEDSLGFTPEDSANKGAVSGYAGLDASQKLLLTNFPSGNALEVLRRNAGNTALEFAPSAAGKTFFKVVKPVDESVINSTVLQDDDHLRVNLAANKTYSLQMMVWSRSSGPSDPEMSHVLSIPSGASAIRSTLGGLGFVTEDATIIDNISTGFNTEIDFLFYRVIMGGTSGEVVFQWAQEFLSSDTSVIVEKGSTLLVWEE